MCAYLSTFQISVHLCVENPPNEVVTEGSERHRPIRAKCGGDVNNIYIYFFLRCGKLFIYRYLSLLGYPYPLKHRLRVIWSLWLGRMSSGCHWPNAPWAEPAAEKVKRPRRQVPIWVAVCQLVFCFDVRVTLIFWRNKNRNVQANGANNSPPNHLESQELEAALGSVEATPLLHPNTLRRYSLALPRSV